ncbi:ABC transporter ATP-binding protein [Microbacterium sp.]|uniref:ABC transporter ATP-binding protein n=1 Tax=Microbacterium sp. TaxID=51671 RepID=UPI0039E391C6
MSVSPLPTAEPAETRRALGALLRVRWVPLGLAALTLCAASVSALALPAALGFIVDAVVAGDSARLPWLIGLLLAAGLLSAVLTGLGRLLVARLGEGVLAQLREQVVSRLLHLPSIVVERAGRGDLVSRAASDARVVGDVVSSVLPSFASAGFSVAVTIVGLGAIDWRFALAALAAVPVQVLATRRYLKHARPAYLAARAAEGERSRRVLETIDAASTVRAMGVAVDQEKHVDGAARDAVRMELRAARVSVGLWNRLNAAELIGLGSVLAVGFALAQSGAATVGGATVAALYFHALFGPIGTVLSSIDELQKASAALARMTGVLQLPERVRPPVREGRAPTAVELDGVCFAYGEGFAVTDVSFSIPAGRTAAVVGASGAGKSTVAALVLGTLDADAGAVRFGGHEDQLPRVGLAGQEPHVFAGTLAEDLRLARPSADDADLRRVLAQVGASEWTARLPEGLDTVIGAGGHALTVVESQQLALARLLLHDPDVLVLDEATAAAGGTASLDSAVAQAAAGRTTLTIAHRLDQAARADVVIVMDGGRVVEQGPHEELVARGGPYARLWEAWSRGEGSR